MILSIPLVIFFAWMCVLFLLQHLFVAILGSGMFSRSSKRVVCILCWYFKTLWLMNVMWWSLFFEKSTAYHLASSSCSGLLDPCLRSIMTWPPCSQRCIVKNRPKWWWKKASGRQTIPSENVWWASSCPTTLPAVVERYQSTCTHSCLSASSCASTGSALLGVLLPQKKSDSTSSRSSDIFKWLLINAAAREWALPSVTRRYAPKSLRIRESWCTKSS